MQKLLTKQNVMQLIKLDWTFDGKFINKWTNIL